MPLEQFIKQAVDVSLLRLVTAGSVDDGKSTLIGRLLHDAKSIYEDHLAALHSDSRKAGREEIDFALLTDGLRAEREQGITIDVAYRHFVTPRRRFIIADTPGHEQYTRNMVTGASNADLAVILIDVQNGVTTQSKRHGFIASLLGIPHIVITVNKMDLVGYSQDAFERIVGEYTEFASKLQVRDLNFIPISALKGDNVVHRSEKIPWYDGPPLLSYLETVHIASDRNLIDFRLPVQYVLRPSANFRGYCGSIASGVLRVGDDVLVLPSGKRTRISSIINDRQEVEYAFAPQPVTVCVADELDIGRGDMLAHPANIPWVAHEIEAILIWMHEEPMRPNRTYLVKHTTNIVRGQFLEIQYLIDPGTLHRLPAEQMGLNDIGRVNMRVFRPILCDEYQRNRQTGGFIVIDQQTNFTVGAGIIIDRLHRYESPAKHIKHHVGHVAPEERQWVLGQRPATIWLTGLSASGKSTIAHALERRLTDEGHACFVLDGDIVRDGLNRDLGFSAEDRAENIRRVAEVARLFNEAGLIVIASFISPFEKDRANARKIIGDERFIEVFVDAPLEVCEQRDPKRLYEKARRGEIPEFTGVSSPYERPLNPDIHLPTDRMTVEQAVRTIMTFLKDKGVL